MSTTPDGAEVPDRGTAFEHYDRFKRKLGALSDVLENPPSDWSPDMVSAARALLAHNRLILWGDAQGSSEFVSGTLGILAGALGVDLGALPEAEDYKELLVAKHRPNPAESLKSRVHAIKSAIDRYSDEVGSQSRSTVQVARELLMQAQSDLESSSDRVPAMGTLKLLAVAFGTEALVLKQASGITEADQNMYYTIAGGESERVSSEWAEKLYAVETAIKAREGSAHLYEDKVGVFLMCVRAEDLLQELENLQQNESKAEGLLRILEMAFDVQEPMSRGSPGAH